MTDVIDRLICEIRELRAAQAEAALPQTAVHRRQVAEHFGIDITSAAQIVRMEEADHRPLMYEVEFRDETNGDLIRASLERDKPIAAAGINLNPGDTLTFTPTYTFNDLLDESLHWHVERTRQMPPEFTYLATAVQHGWMSAKEARAPPERSIKRQPDGWPLRPR